ncbi:3043_t:CDS:1, partial [Gigaspora rosea]
LIKSMEAIHYFWSTQPIIQSGRPSISDLTRGKTVIRTEFFKVNISQPVMGYK